MNTAIFTPARMNQAFAKVRRNSDCAETDGLTPTVYALDRVDYGGFTVATIALL